MQFEIDPLLFDDEKSFVNLERLISLCTYKDKHLIIVDYSCFSKTNFNKLSSNLKESLMASFKWLVNINVNRESKKYVYVSNKINNERSLDIESAYYLAELHFEILIENSANDQPFIDSIISNFSSKGSDIIKYRNNGWLKFGNGGGCSNFINYIEAQLKQYNNICGIKDNYFFLRIFAILDSDRLHDGENLGKYQEKNEIYFLEKNISYHILERRCMENYLPDETLKELIGYPHKNKEWFDAYISLNSIQKQYLDFNKGILKGSKIEFNDTKTFADLPNEVQLLFSDVSDINFSKINKGLILSSYKSTIPTGFNMPTSNKMTYLRLIKDQKNPNELQHIIDKIEEII